MISGIVIVRKGSSLNRLGARRNHTERLPPLVRWKALHIPECYNILPGITLFAIEIFLNGR